MISKQISIWLRTTSAIVIALLVASAPFLLWSDAAKASTWPGYNGKILISSDLDGDFEVYTLDNDGTNLTQLTQNNSLDYVPKWSPDGTRIVFDSNRDGNFEIYVMDADGSNQVRLTNNSSDDVRPMWSPDGTQIAYTSYRDGNGKIYVMNADGSNQVRLTNNSTTDIYAQWSPDGEKILYQAPQFGNTSELYTINADGTNPIRLTNNSASDSNARWSPDGTRIVFDSNRDGNGEIYVMNADGSNQVRLTNNSVANFGGLWSPTGNRILYTQCNVSFTQCDIWQMNSDGSSQVKLFDAPAPEFPNVDMSLSIYSPDGKYLIVDAWNSGWTIETSFLVSLDEPEWSQLINTPSDTYASDYQPLLNQPPVLGSTATSMQSGSSTLVDVLADASDEEALSASNVTVTGAPAHGSASVEAGKIRYTANGNYAGPDSVGYQVCDSFMLDQKCSTETLSVTVNPAVGVTKVGSVTTNGTGAVTSSSLRPTFSGTATPGSEVTVEIHSDPIILTTMADGSGNWSVTPQYDLPSGQCIYRRD